MPGQLITAVQWFIECSESCTCLCKPHTCRATWSQHMVTLPQSSPQPSAYSAQHVCCEYSCSFGWKRPAVMASTPEGPGLTAHQLWLQAPGEPNKIERITHQLTSSPPVAATVPGTSQPTAPRRQALKWAVSDLTEGNQCQTRACSRAPGCGVHAQAAAPSPSIIEGRC